MFEQQEKISDALFFAQFYEALLQAQSRSVVNDAQLEDGDHNFEAADMSRFLISP
jgi:hypothetical protein